MDGLTDMADIEFDAEDLPQDPSEGDGEGSGPLKGRLGSALGKARERSQESLRDLGRTVSALGDRLKRTPAAERLNAAVDARLVVRKAADAQRRGNDAMAYRLLEPLARERPDDVQVVVAFFATARACARADEAAPALVHIVRALASAGKTERAAELWYELHECAPETLLDPGSLVRIVPALQEGSHPEAIVAALRDAVDSRNHGLSPGIAVRVAEMALEPDPPTALRAARVALAAPGLHDARRLYLESIVTEGERAGPGPRALAAEVPAKAENAERAVAEVIEGEVPATRFRSVKLTEAMPIGFREQSLAVQVEGGRRVGVSYEQIEAISVAGVADRVVIDLVLNWRSEGDEVLRLVRFQSDGFDPRMVIETSDGHEDPLASFLMELMGRSEAMPLPDPESALGLNVRAFDNMALYEREVLQVGR